MRLDQEGLEYFQAQARAYRSNVDYYTQQHKMRPGNGYDQDVKAAQDRTEYFETVVELYEQALKEVVP